MNSMLDLVRSRLGAKPPAARPARDSSRRSRLAVEALEGRSLLAASSLGSFFSGLFPNTGAGSLNTTTKYQLQILHQPPTTTFPIYGITLGVAPDNDPAATGQVFGKQVQVPSSSAIGTAQASGTQVRIQGTAPPNATLWVAFGELGYFRTITQADAKGVYYFDINLPSATTLVRVFSESSDHNFSRVSTLRLSVANPIAAWDAIALKVIANEQLTGEQAAHDLAILHLAQYDAVAATTDPVGAFGVQVAAAPGASAVAAADSAAYHVLASLYPDQATPITSAYNVVVKTLPTTQATTDGLTLGQTAAERTLAARQGDGSTVTNAQGQTVPNPNYSQVKPFAITNPATFRPAAPPKAGTPAFDQALAEVTRLGRFNSTSRTTTQTATAEFWDDEVGTRTSAGHWNAIAEELVSSHRTNLATSARLFATLDVALADAGIATASSQQTFLEPRPISTIQRTDPTWTPLLATPPTPSYVSEHAAFAAAASDVLASTFGSSTHFTTDTDPNDPVVGQIDPTNYQDLSRTYKNFAAAATEAAGSRVLGGVSYRFDTTAGATLGASVGKVVLSKFTQA